MSACAGGRSALNKKGPATNSSGQRVSPRFLGSRSPGSPLSLAKSPTGGPQNRANRDKMSERRQLKQEPGSSTSATRTPQRQAKGERRARTPLGSYRLA